MNNELISKIEQAEIEYKLAEPMKNHTTFKIGGNAEIFLTPASYEECAQAIKICKNAGEDYIVIGKGSNLLVNDDGIDGVVICISKLMSNMELMDNDTIYCQSGASLASVCNFALENSLTGLEFAYGIPGNIGGAVSMNAGAYGGEMKDIVISCDYIDDEGALKTISKQELDFSYRQSFFSDKNFCIVGATLKLGKGNKEVIRKAMDELLGRRKEKQPLEFPSAGSTFKRPEGSYASLLIDECGLKGYSVGDAQVSEKHAGFVINRGNASCIDVVKLMSDVKEIVFEKTGYVLEPEVKLI